MNEDELLQALADDLDDEAEMEDEPEQAKGVTFRLTMNKGETVHEADARAALTPEYHAAFSICQLNKVLVFKEANVTELAARLEHQTQQLKDGDLGQAESMLASQAYTLDALFHSLLRRSALNGGNEFEVIEKLMKLALKAQSQCRTTLDSLASIKNPTVLMRQTNIAQNQQINNGPENEKTQSKLLGKTDGERLDFGKAETPVTANQGVETVGK